MAFFKVFAPNTFAFVRAYNLGFVTFAIIFETTTALAVTPFGVRSVRCLAYFRMECIGISIQTHANGTLSRFLVLQIIVTATTIAIITKLPVSKTVAIELETLRSIAVARTTIYFGFATKIRNDEMKESSHKQTYVMIGFGPFKAKTVAIPLKPFLLSEFA